MKKKLLTVLLAVVMVFGVFSLAACGDKVNPDSEYNYYGTKYELDGEVKIQAATFQGVYKMFTTAGNYLLYIDSEAGDAKARFAAINKLAQDWDVTIYHFNPNMGGGYAANNSNAENANIATVLTGKAAASQLKLVQDTFLAISKLSAVPDNSLLGITGAAPSYSIDADGATIKTTYKGKATVVAYNEGAKAIAAIATKKPSYAQYAESGNTAVPAAYNTDNIKGMNLFADGRLHMYNEDGTDAFQDEKTDVYVTVANYAQFAHLMDNNEGYFAVFFGGTWCPNTQAIAKLTNDIAKDYGIKKIYFFDPRLDDGTKVDKLAISTVDGEKTVSVTANGSYLASSLNTRTANAASDAAYNYNFLYAQFLNEYLPTYQSKWNYGVKLSITSNGETKDYTKMCVPNMMMFNGEGEGKAALVSLAEAEYTWANTSVEGNPQHDEWYAAIETIFKANPYHVYNPIPDAPAADDSAASGSTGGSAAPAGGDSGGC